MKVFKFGGASIRNAMAIQEMTAIVKSHAHQPLIIIISAMDKTTNAMEEIINLYKQQGDAKANIELLRTIHLKIIANLFSEPQSIIDEIDTLFKELTRSLHHKGDDDEIYDRVVSFGELISSKIIHLYLLACGITTEWKDARHYVITDASFREGKVDWKITEEKISTLHRELKTTSIITQGFIGSTYDGRTTTLGREGSDFSAAIFASCLQANEVIIWKDVPGVMSADPKRLPNAVVFPELPYKEAAEMTYYGASVIHPKTIKPLALKNIPLFVKSFQDPTLPGTKIHECHVDNLPPMFVFKDNQCLISCKVVDYTFINEQQLGIIFQALSDLNIKLNVMQNSAISFSFCIDFRANKLMALVERLHQHFEVYYNTNLTLITVKNYDEVSFDTYRKQPGVLMEQSSRSTLQVLVKTSNV